MRRPAVIVLLLLALAAVLAVAGCGGEETVSPTAETVVGTLPEEPEETTTEADSGAATEGDPEAGKEVFASAGCASCHTLADAGATGAVGPNLDEAMPDDALVVERVTNGMGIMPAFGDSLSEQDIQNVAAYVSSVAGS